MAMVFNHDNNRESYSTGEFVDHVTFNALSDNAELGDEKKNFVTVRKNGEKEYKKFIDVSNGDKFTVKIYFHNNADPSLKEKGTSNDTKIGFTSGNFCSFEDEWKDEKFHNVESEGFMGYIYSKELVPESVRDFCVVQFHDYCSYKYIEARITNSAGTHKFQGPGYPDYCAEKIGVGQDMNGEIPAGASGFVELDFEVVNR